jgi:HSP20 family molecular chaperone IbpA
MLMRTDPFRELERLVDNGRQMPRSFPMDAYRQVFLGETLDGDRLEADYRDGVLTLRVPVAESAKPPPNRDRPQLRER